MRPALLQAGPQAEGCPPRQKRDRGVVRVLPDGGRNGGAAWDGSALFGGLLEILAEQAGGEQVWVNGMGRLLRVGREIK